MRRRPVEIEHGRFSLYACIGYFVREYSELGGYLSPSIGIKFSDGPNGFGRFLEGHDLLCLTARQLP